MESVEIWIPTVKNGVNKRKVCPRHELTSPFWVTGPKQDEGVTQGEGYTSTGAIVSTWKVKAR